jgi:uncharacterized protein YecT (DUF1311 family)
MPYRLLLTAICCGWLLPLALEAQEARSDCYDKAQTQFELNSCAGAEYVGADAELNLVYKEVLEKYKSDSKFIAKFRDAQRAWLKYRDAEFEAKFPHADETRYYGSVFPMCASQYRARLTRERIIKLREWLNGAEEGDVCAGSVD